MLNEQYYLLPTIKDPQEENLTIIVLTVQIIKCILQISGHLTKVVNRNFLSRNKQISPVLSVLITVPFPGCYIESP